MAENTDSTEEQLVTYIKNILSYQIMPMDFMDLRNLLKESPKQLKLHEFVEEKYPDSEFLSFLQKYPDIFSVNADRTVKIAGPNYCTISFPKNTDGVKEIYDEIDGKDKKEYISDDSDSDDSESEKVTLLNQENKNLSKVECSEDRRRVIIETSSSSCSESSDEFSSSEIVQTSDSLSSSLSSVSTSEN